MIHQKLLQPEAAEGVPSLSDPVAGTPLLTKEIALVGFYPINFHYLTLPHFVIFFKCHRGRRPHQGAPAVRRALVPGPCWHVLPGPDPVTGAVSHRQRAPAGRPRRRGPGGAGTLPLTGGEAQGSAVAAPAPQGHPRPPRGSPRSTQGRCYLSSHGMQRERGAPQPHAPGFAARHGRHGTPRQRLPPCLPVLTQSLVAPQETARPTQLVGWSR